MPQPPRSTELNEAEGAQALDRFQIILAGGLARTR